jgi:protein subunit release factor A
VGERRAPRAARAGHRERGRIHTSAATVAGAPRGGGGRPPDRGQGPAHRRVPLVGPGGQSVNTTDSACASRTSPRAWW